MKKIIFLFSLLFASTPVLSQSLSIFDIDTSSFPIMKAKIFAMDADGKQASGINPSDLSLTENGIPREVISVTCPPTKPAQRISSTIVIDVSGSMSGGPLDIAKTVAKTWVNALPLGQSDCALVSFNGSNYFNQDFTTNRNKLLSAIDGLSSDDGTDYNAAMINPAAGGILTAKAGKHRKVIVFITDGMPNSNPDEARIISEALANGIIIHCITIGLPAHPSMIRFAEQTHGMLFENVKTEEEAKSIAQMLLGRSVYDFQPCEIQWKSDLTCDRRFLDVVLSWSSLFTTAKYFIPESGIAKLEVEPMGVRFINKPIGIKADTTISITTVNADYSISGFICSDQRFSVSPPNLKILKGETKVVTLSFIPIDSSLCYTSIEIQNNRCASSYYSEGVYPNRKLNYSNLKLTYPNGGEEFIVGTDTLIAWEGVLPQDTVKLEYSYNQGETWNLITNIAKGFKYDWNNVPRPESKKCLVKITSNKNDVNIEWEKHFGGSDLDICNGVIETKNGYLVFGESMSNNGDIDEFHGFFDIWILYLNKVGNPIWKKRLGDYSYEYGFSAVELDDGSFVIGGTTNSTNIDTPKGNRDYWIIKLDISGNILWSKRYGGSLSEDLYCLEKTKDGGILAVGSSNSLDKDISGNHGFNDAWIIKLDSNGNLIWQKSLGGSGGDIAYSVVQTTDNCFVIAGTTESSNGNIPKNQGKNDCWVAKINTNGNLIWSRTYGGINIDVFRSIKETKDLGFIVAGYSDSNIGDIKNNQGKMDALVAKLDANGNIQWINTIGGSSDDEANSIVETIDGGFLFVGHSYSDDGDVFGTPKVLGDAHFWMVKLKNNGQILWTKVLDKYHNDKGTSVQQTEDEGFIAAGVVIRDKKNSYEYLIIKFFPEQIPQSDVSDSLFSIVAPKITAMNIDMGQVVLGSYKDSVITAFIKNTSKYDCQIKDIKSASSDFYVISNPTYTLKGNTEQAIEIHFKPGKLGKIYSNINVVTQDTSFSQSIEGEGVQPTLQISTNLIDFGKVNVKEVKDTAIVLLENVSGGPIDISDVKLLGPDKKQFEILDGGGSFTLATGQTRELKIRFKPVYIGRTTCQLGFFHNGINSPAKAQLYGQGVGGLVTVSDDSAYAGEIVKMNMVLSHIAPSSLQNVASSFKAKLKYLTAPLSLVNTALKIGETPDSTIIEVSGVIGSDSVLYTIDFIANDTPKDFTTIDLEEIKWFDADGNEIDYEAETQDGSFKLLKRYSSVYCENVQAYPDKNITIKLAINGSLPGSLQSVASTFTAKIKYLTAPLEIKDKSLIIDQTSDSTTIEVKGAIPSSGVLYQIEFYTKDSDWDFTKLNIIDFKWLDYSGKEVICLTEKVSGSFKLLKYSGMAKVYCTSDSARPGEKVTLQLKTSGIDPLVFKEIITKFQAKLRYQKTILAALDKSKPTSYSADSAYIVVDGDVGESPELASIDFIAGLGSVDSTTIDIVEIEWLNSKGEEVAFNTETQSGSFKLLGVCREGGERLFNPTGKAGIEELSPNPARDEINVTVNQTEEGDSYLIVYNILGNEVMREKLGGSTTGKKEIKLSLTNCARGIYYLKYQSPTVTEVKSFIAE